MSQQDFIRKIVSLLERAGVPHMLTGSFGSSIHGEPRTTNDIDVVIAPTRPQLDELLQLLSPDFYVSPAAARDALKNRGMFNVVEYTSGWKADLIIIKDRPFSAEEFNHRLVVEAMGMSLPVVSPENAILSKLEWMKLRPSDRQFRDCLGIALVQRGKLDVPYLRRWAAELGVTDLLEKLLSALDQTKE
jgi:predicted nucleotidyltransferase